jgi:hypothetical protein
MGDDSFCTWFIFVMVMNAKHVIILYLKVIEKILEIMKLKTNESVGLNIYRLPRDTLQLMSNIVNYTLWYKIINVVNR